MASVTDFFNLPAFILASILDLAMDEEEPGRLEVEIAYSRQQSQHNPAGSAWRPANLKIIVRRATGAAAIILVSRHMFYLTLRAALQRYLAPGAIELFHETNPTFGMAFNHALDVIPVAERGLQIEWHRHWGVSRDTFITLVRALRVAHFNMPALVGFPAYTENVRGRWEWAITAT